MFEACCSLFSNRIFKTHWYLQKILWHLSLLPEVLLHYQKWHKRRQNKRRVKFKLSIFQKGIKDRPFSTSFQLYQIQKIIFYLGKTRNKVDFLLTRWENVWKGRWTFFDGRKLGNGNDSRLLGFSRSPRVPASYRLWLLSFTFLTDVRLPFYIRIV